MLDNLVDFNPLAAIPSGLGLTFAFNGTSPTIATTESGVWSFLCSVSGLAAADANIRASLQESFAGFGTPFGPITANQLAPPLTFIYEMPAAASGAITITTTVAAAANPYTTTPILAITRLA
jgi:hypothetical protein